MVKRPQKWKARSSSEDLSTWEMWCYVAIAVLLLFAALVGCGIPELFSAATETADAHKELAEQGERTAKSAETFFTTIGLAIVWAIREIIPVVKKRIARNGKTAPPETG